MKRVWGANSGGAGEGAPPAAAQESTQNCAAPRTAAALHASSASPVIKGTVGVIASRARSSALFAPSRNSMPMITATPPGGAPTFSSVTAAGGMSPMNML